MGEEPNLIFSPRLSRIKVKSFFEKEFRRFLERREVDLYIIVQRLTNST